MGIDRIGKGGATPPLVPTKDGTAGTSAPRAAEPTAAFEVPGSAQKSAPGRAEASAAVSTVPPNPLERLRSGEIDVHGYMDLKVDEATAHLASLPASEVAAIRKMLRDQLATDPGLAALVQQATGHTPAPPEE